MKPRLAGMTTGLALGIGGAVVLACVLSAYAFSVHHLGTQLESERRTALALGEVMRTALEHQMMENDRTLIEALVASFAREPTVTAVALLDRRGEVRYSSGARLSPADLLPDSPTCQACHRLPAEQRGSSRVVETAGGKVLRTMIALPNHPRCHGCHDGAHRINGVMILDLDAGGIQREMNRDLRWMVAGAAVIALVLIGAIAGVVRLAVLRRLQRFETTARKIAEGDLQRRVPAEGSDTISWLATEFNAMADSMSGLVGEVRRERERLETVINSIDDGIVVLDGRRRVIAANDAFLRRTGGERARALGCFCRDVAPGVCSARDCPTLSCLSTGEPQVRVCERLTSDGGVRWEEVHASPIRGPAGTVAQVVEVWRDITDRRAAEARLAESHRLASLGLLASGFSHEISTPLGTVLACVEGILRDVPPAPDADGAWAGVGESAAIAREQVLRCRGITQHFLRLARGQSPSVRLVELRSAVAAVIRLIQPTALARSVSVALEEGGRPVNARADEAELQHALVNLVLNAVQACAPGGHVRLSVADGEVARVRVKDDGCGIPADSRARIFEPFFSLRPEGTGLGLFLALNFVRRWGGEILVESAPGAGSTFELRLPPAEASAPQAAW